MKLQPVQAWAAVEDATGTIRALYVHQENAVRDCRIVNMRGPIAHVEPVTVRAWAPPKQKQVTR